ncbi:MAG: hypothetical protein LBD30_03785, partial [Verrucomicrobiales bacterium]|nr:hypothetical protein [Verrucomicrobiales bacterium]
TLEYALASDSSIRLTVSGQTLDVKPARTDSWRQYRTVGLGTLELADGEQELTLSGSGAGGVINLRKIILTPTPKKLPTTIDKTPPIP